MRKKIFAVILTAALAVSCLAGCGKSASSDGSSINVCVGSEPDTIDPALNSAVDGATYLVHLFSGLAKWEQKPDGSLEIVADAAQELVDGVENADGTVTYTYTLRDGLKWSDGQPVKASDFVFAWNRAASAELGADYGYMFEVIDGYDEISAVDDDGNPINADAKLNVNAPDDKTIVVTLYNAVSYWNELLAFPSYFPVREDVVANEGWATEASTYVCNGPYKIDSWDHQSVIRLVKNPDFVDAKDITMSQINFYLSDDQNNMLTNFKNGDWQLIDDIPTNEMASVKAEYPDEYVVAGNLGTYYVCWNVNEQIMPEGSEFANEEYAKAEVRRAVGLLFDRNYICDEIGQAGQVPASSFVAMGMTEPDGSQFYENAGTNSYTGYYDVSADAYTENFNQAISVLKKYYDYDETTGKFTNFPTLTYIYNTSEGHKAIGEYLQSTLAGVGITMNLENQEWATFLNTRKEGNYSIARNGWLADYNDPICFLDMWTTDSGNNDVQFGRGAHKDGAVYDMDLTPYGYDIKVQGTWSETYDVLISTIKRCTDENTRYQLMHVAEDMLMDTGCITPLYYYTDPYMISKNVDGFFANPLGYKYFMFTKIS